MPAPTNAEIAYQQSGLLDRWTLYTTQLRDWLGGVATGGPNGDGAYPLQDVTGQTFLVPCVAAWQAKVDAITDPLTGLQATADQAVTDAQAAQTAAAASETNAAASATTAQSASSDASMYATNSANSAADSLTYKNAAGVSATNAAASATAAATSETNAAASATSASSDATAAANSAQAADASAQQAATYATGRLTYIGSWDVSGGTLPSIGNRGDFYAITGTATIGGVEYANGDMAVSDGSTGFNKIDNTDKVTSVAGLIGTISTAQLQTALNLGTAAYQPTAAFATAAQGAKADSAVQPNTQPTLSGLITTPLPSNWGWQSKVGTTIKLGLFINSDGTPSLVNTESWQQLFFKADGSLQYSGPFSAATVIAEQLRVGASSSYAFWELNSGYMACTNSWVRVLQLDVTNNVTVAGTVTAANIGAAAAGTSRTYVQSTDPGAVPDGSLWVW